MAKTRPNQRPAANKGETDESAEFEPATCRSEASNTTRSRQTGLKIVNTCSNVHKFMPLTVPGSVLMPPLVTRCRSAQKAVEFRAWVTKEH